MDPRWSWLLKPVTVLPFPGYLRNFVSLQGIACSFTPAFIGARAWGYVMGKQVGWMIAYKAKSSLTLDISIYELSYECQLLAFSYSEHLSATYGANTLSCWFAVLHGYGLGIPHFPLGAALNTVCLHFSPPL